MYVWPQIHLESNYIWIIIAYALMNLLYIEKAYNHNVAKKASNYTMLQEYDILTYLNVLFN